MTFQRASQRDLIHLMENREHASSEAFLELLDGIVLLQGCGWELGPDPEDPARDILAFSRLGNSANAERISEEMDLPIIRSDWSVIIGIPPRNWDRYFQYTDAAGQSCEIEGSSWRYAMFDSGDMAEIRLDPGLATDPDICEELANILCVGELGENNIADFVSRISCAKLELSESKPLSSLRGEFVHRFPACHYAPVFRSEEDNLSL